MTSVTGNAIEETEVGGSEVDCAIEHEDNRIEGHDDQDGTEQTVAAREEDSDECDRLLQRFSTFSDCIVAKAHENPDIRYALQRFLDKGENTRPMQPWHQPFTALAGTPDCHHWATNVLE